MPSHPLIHPLGLIASLLLPLFNIPLMIRIIKRRSSDDISLVWALGVFTCMVLILPSGLASVDFTFRIFSILNLVFFSGVVFLVLWYRWKRG